MDLTERLERDGAGPEEAGLHFAQHVELRTVVLPDLRMLFLPIPRAACTSILWLLARLAGIPQETFAHSGLPEVSPGLTVHDMSLWGPGHRLADYQGEDRERVLTEEGWLRFAVVRHPGTRLWSAWQSKLLLREPRFVAAFGEEPWFPRVPERPADLVDDFRRFVGALPGGDVEDVHWAVQHQLTTRLPLSHVGRVEELDRTLELLRQQVPADVWPDDFGAENRTGLPPPPSPYDESAAAILHERYRPDFEEYGYERVETAAAEGAVAAWEEHVASSLPLLRETIDRHARIGQLHHVARRVQTVEGRLEDSTTRQLGRSRSPVLANLEGHAGFNVRWAWADGLPEPGFTAVVRAKNEERALPWVLPPLLRAARRVVLVDNGSTDRTLEVAHEAAAAERAEDRLEVHSYPFSVARCGEEHLGTPAASVHSLVYFYNWSFAHVRTRYALKWDADMVLTEAAVQVFRDLAWQLEAADAVVKVPRYPLYVAGERHAFLDLGLANNEPWAWPNRPGYSFVKAMEWEQPILPPDVPRIVLPDCSCVELKYLDADEFSHWSDTDFDQTARTQRKRREWEVFSALAEGQEPPSDVVAVEAPAGEHVIDYVRSVWLRERENEPLDLAERLVRRLARAAV